MFASLLSLRLWPRLRASTRLPSAALSKRQLSAAQTDLGESFFPGGAATLERIASGNLFYADRTLDALRIVHQEERIVFPGPPRFGKTLMLDAADAICNVVPKPLPVRSWGAKLRQAVSEVDVSDLSAVQGVLTEMDVPSGAMPWQYVVVRFDLADTYSKIDHLADLKFEQSLCHQILLAGRVYG
eukprot:CAMPEP_0196779712 /NCGR_PEP_ID=MMETSP1104-20130614/6545_1 /TAXON_ID=33652 /ORGANISM="Cafeteria sp., Strain Caron Lab Isolate" /LENGTH=184 /DNA_ID=CAMNT_0042149895 /DNA_START=31 /DNA_END=582 /DNA_ORIENTATION=+